ncbi:unnamed protein product [Pieris brassicae]|uniref:Longin domain-containing protein n=1 Tax=Pieris brassicae TaxID=7116 RepID=A0A9P0XGB2_PIEBR|nr:unnamed protein product [Pieris brassicae]
MLSRTNLEVGAHVFEFARYLNNILYVMRMSILFSAVVCDKVVVEQFATCDGNFNELLELVMRRIPERNDKMTYSFGRYLMHYINEDGRFYFCITHRSCQRSRAFLFLNEVKRQNKRKILAKQMYRYNENYGSIVIRSGELEEINSIGVDSSESLLGDASILVENHPNVRNTVSVAFWIFLC